MYKQPENRVSIGLDKGESHFRRLVIINHMDFFLNRNRVQILCGQLTPYSIDIDLGQHWLRLWFGAWQYHTITWNDDDL